MLLANDGFAEDSRRNRDIGFADEFKDIVLKTEAMDFDIGKNDWLAGSVNHFCGFRESRLKCFGVAAFVKFWSFVKWNTRNKNEIARNLDINRTFVAEGCMQHTVNLLESGLGVAQDGGSDRELFENFFLSIEFADFMMEQWVFFALLHSGGAADNDDRRFFGESFRRGVCDLEAPNAVSDAHGSETANPCIGIGGEAGALFVASIDDAQFAF
jgi:hypothetical protein